MLPPELDEDIIILPETDKHTIVIVTGKDLRHKRFAYRMHQEFGDLMIAWYELDSNAVPYEKSKKAPIASDIGHTSKVHKIRHLLTRELPEYYQKYGFWYTVNRLTTLAGNAWYQFVVMRNIGEEMHQSEEKLFGKELVSLQGNIDKKPIKIHPSDVCTERFRQEIKLLDPYFFLTLDGTFYYAPLLESIRGAAINQHAGHSPLYKGNNTIHWALYHRDLDSVSATVHISATGTDADTILRRSNPTIFPDNDLHTIFFRSVALGTELMIESVREIIADKSITVFRHPKNRGRTYLNKEYDFPVRKALFKDFRTGFLRTAINGRRSF